MRCYVTTRSHWVVPRVVPSAWCAGLAIVVRATSTWPYVTFTALGTPQHSSKPACKLQLHVLEMAYVLYRAILALCACIFALGQNFSLTRLRVEYLEAPLTVEIPTPRFSWALVHPMRAQAMTSYKIVVTKMPSSIVVWDSGTVVSNTSTNVPFVGSAREPDSDYSWSVVCSDASGSFSEKAVSTFSTALFGPNAWHGASWVSSPLYGALNTYRAELNLSGGDVLRARLYVTGLGYAKTWLNGGLTDDHELGSFTTFEMRTLYDVVNVTSQLRLGCNTLGVMLGNGWFSQPSVNVGPRQFRLLLSVTMSGTETPMYFGSSLSQGAPGSLVFAATAGPVLADDIYIGETFSGPVAAALKGWSECGFIPPAPWNTTVAPAVSPDTLGAVSSAHTVPIRIDRTFSTLSVNEPLPNLFVFGEFVLSDGHHNSLFLHRLPSMPNLRLWSKYGWAHDT